MFQAHVERETFVDPVSADVAALMRSQRDAISSLIDRADGSVVMVIAIRCAGCE
jgi:hypothetical protein